MRKPWLPVIVIVSVMLMGGLTLLVRHVATLRKETQARRAAEERDRQREADRREVAVAFNDPVPPTADEAATFERVFAALGRDLANEDRSAIAAAFDMERFASEIGRWGGLNALPGGNSPQNRAAFIRGMQQGVGQALANNPLIRWERTEIRRVRWSADRNEAVVIAVHRSAALEDYPTKVRWWLIKQPGGWKVYDLEELDMGTRLSSLMGSMLDQGVIRQLMADPTRFQNAATAIREGAVAIVLQRDVAEAERQLNLTRGIDLPAPLAALREILDGRIRLERGDGEGALERFDEVERLMPGIPVLGLARASALASLARYDEALPLVQKYQAELGPSADSLLVEGVCLEGLNRAADAATAYRKALDDHPALADAFDGLRRVLPNAKKAELGDRLAKTRDPAKLFDQLTNLARQDQDDAAVEAYEAAFRKLLPNDPRGITAKISRLVKAEKFADAAAEMKAGLAVVPADKRLQVLNSYLFEMLGADRAAEGYAAAPDADARGAFRLLADDLEDYFLDGDADSGKYTRQLRELIAAHKKRIPNDPWTGYFEGTLLQHAKKYEEAGQKFAEAQAAYRKAKPTTKEKEKDWEADRFRSRRVACLLALKQGPKAYAEIGPAEETFLQLAHAYEFAKDWEALEAMIATHRREQAKDRNGAYWAANVLYLRGKYADAAPALRKYLDGADNEDANRWQATERCIRAYLRAGRARDAREAVAEFGEKRVAPGLRAAVALAGGHAAEAEAILAEQATKGGKPEYLYYDEDFSRLIAAPEFAELRKKYPDPRPAPKGTGVVG
jgi:hypothetical protein